MEYLSLANSVKSFTQTSFYKKSIPKSRLHEIKPFISTLQRNRSKAQAQSTYFGSPYPDLHPKLVTCDAWAAIAGWVERHEESRYIVLVHRITSCLGKKSLASIRRSDLLAAESPLEGESRSSC